MPFSLHFLQYRRNPYPRSNLNKGTSQRGNPCASTVKNSYARHGAFAIAIDEYTRVLPPRHSQELYSIGQPYALPKQATQGFNSVLHPYSAPHSAMWPGYSPLVATSSPCQKPQALQASTPTMAYQQPHKRRDQIGVPMLTFLSVTSTTQ